MRLDEGGNVGEDQARGAGETAVPGFPHRAAPAALIKAVDLDSGRSQVREEVIVAVYVVGEAVDEDELGLGGAGGLVGGVSSGSGGKCI